MCWQTCLLQVLKVFFRVGFEPGDCSRLTEVNLLAVVFDGRAFWMHTGIGIHRAKELLHWLNFFGGHLCKLRSLLPGYHGEIVRVLCPHLLAGTAAHEDLHALVDEEFFGIDFVLDHERAMGLFLHGLKVKDRTDHNGGYHEGFTD